MANNNSTSKFPAPYVNSINENDPVVIRVDQDMSEIGTRGDAIPKDVGKSSRMSIAHVGESK
jgi:hypothetical protein